MKGAQRQHVQASAAVLEALSGGRQMQVVCMQSHALGRGQVRAHVLLVSPEGPAVMVVTTIAQVAGWAPAGAPE